MNMKDIDEGEKRKYMVKKQAVYWKKNENNIEKMTWRNEENENEEMKKTNEILPVEKLMKYRKWRREKI